MKYMLQRKPGGCSWLEYHVTRSSKTMVPCVHAAVDEVAPGIHLCKVHGNTYRELLDMAMGWTDGNRSTDAVTTEKASELIDLWQKATGSKLTEGRAAQLVGSLLLDLEKDALTRLTGILEPEMMAPTIPDVPMIDPYDEKALEKALEKSYKSTFRRELADDMEATKEIHSPFGRTISKDGKFSDVGVAWEK